METNLKEIKFGQGLKIKVRKYQLVGESMDKHNAERFCTIISRNTGIPAAPYFSNGNWNTIITEYRLYIKKRSFQIDELLIKVESLEETFLFGLSDIHTRNSIIQLYKRALLTQVLKKTDLWTILGMPSIFYEKDPFLKSDFIKKFNVSDIQGFRRFEIADQYIEGKGLTFAINVSTAFFTSLTVDDYHKGYVDRFNQLAGRQKEQKGTLMYDGPNGRSKCYFKQYRSDMTLSTTGEMIVGSQKYASLYEYYKVVAPNYDIKPGDKVACVSFPNMKEKQVLVPANKLILRVMNDALDRKMSQHDKIEPGERTKLINKFWNKLGNMPFGSNFAPVATGCFNPGPEQCGIIPLSPLTFGDHRKLQPPVEMKDYAYKKHYGNRKNYLQNFGCFYVPETMQREIHFVYPKHIDEHLADFFAKECCAMIEKLTKVKIEPIVQSYDLYDLMTSELVSSYEPGMVVFAFDDFDSLTYFNIRFELKDWQLKRLTTHELKRSHKGYKDYKEGYARNGDRGLRNWEGFVEQNVLDIIQQMGCLPYMIQPKLNYDMQLVIDISAKSKFLGLSLFMFGKTMQIPIYGENIKAKTDSKSEEIARPFLERYLKELINQNKEVIQRHKLNSMLILRDGKDCGEEFKAIQSVIEWFKKLGVFAEDFKYDFIEYHKSTLKQIKIWEKNGPNHVNCLEGSYLLLDRDTGILNTTGAGTLHQGTASPLLIRKKYMECDLVKVLEDIFSTSQLNFSSPRVSQRLTYPAKRTDEQLKDKMAQEILRF